MPSFPEYDFRWRLESKPTDHPLPTFRLDSDEPLPFPAAGFEEEDSTRSAASGPSLSYGAPSGAPPSGESRSAERSPGEIWLDGDVLMCACPDCGAPMTVRLWLMTADCWRCAASIELSEEQQREAERLIRQREAAGKRRPQAKAAPAHPPAARPASAPLSRTPREAAPASPPPAAPPPLPERRQVNGRATPSAAPPSAPARQVAAPPRPRSQSLRPAPRRRRLPAWLNDTPAWLISLVIHLILITLLGLITFEEPNAGPFITLSTQLNRQIVMEGDNTRPLDPEAEFAFDLPLPKEVDWKDAEVREALVRADQDARELRLPEDTVDPFLPDLTRVKKQIRSADFSERTLAARDPRVRTVLVTQEGGTTLTEAAVARGLRWLARQQKPEGRWVLDGGLRSDSAATSLALLPFLGAGQTHLTGKYQKEVAAGLRWLLENQEEDGDLGAGSRGNSHMYAHGQGAIVLCEAFAITGDEQLRLPAQKAIDFIVQAQHPEGGWRYEPGQPGDTSVLGWQLMALQSARAANLTVPPATLENASHYLDSVASDDGARYAYMRGHSPTEVMTAEALLCRMYLGWTLKDRGLAEGVRWLSEGHLPNSNYHNLYYWYYGTQVLHHAGGLDWEKWNVRLRDILVNTQEKRGEDAGCWRPEHHHDRPGGRLYATSLAVCTLEVYYRHVPIFRQINLD